MMGWIQTSVGGAHHQTRACLPLATIPNQPETLFLRTKGLSRARCDVWQHNLPSLLNQAGAAFIQTRLPLDTSHLFRQL